MEAEPPTSNTLIESGFSELILLSPTKWFHANDSTVSNFEP